MYEMAREMRAPAWADTREVGQALFYRDEIALLARRRRRCFSRVHEHRGRKACGHQGRTHRRGAQPWDDASALIRFRIISKAPLRPDQTGWVKFPTKVRSVPAVRASAVIQSPTGPYVLLVSKDKQTFTKRPIQIGSILYQHAAVLSGLEVGERIATLNTFGLDAERRFSGRNQP